MNLIDENEEIEQAQNKKKTLKIILITIMTLILLVIILTVFSIVKKNNTLKLQVDGKSVGIQQGLVLMNDSKNAVVENGQIYLSVRKLISVLGGDIEYYNDEYKNKGEDITKCYIKTANEYTSFLSNSSQIYKAIILDDNQDETTDMTNTTNTTTSSNSKKNNEDSQKVTEYEYFNVENGVKYVNGEIYASQEAIQLGFNVTMNYNEKNKTITIYTLDALEAIAANKVKLAVIGDDCAYYNKKLLKYGLVLIKNSEGDYGITNYNDYQEGNNIISCLYSDIRFCESSSSVIVTRSEDKKQGIFKLDLVNKQKAEEKIKAQYQLIKQLDEDMDLYMVKQDERYGIIKLAGDDITTILKTEYQQIGIDGDLYPDMDNKYVINGKYIPIKIDGKWGIVTTEGKILINPQYVGIGCNLGKIGSGDPVIVLPKLIGNTDAIVFLTTSQENTSLYSIINVQTGVRIGGHEASEIYSRYDNGQRKYYMKITDSTGNVIGNINIYNVYGVKAKEVTNADDANNITNKSNVTNNDTNNTNTN